MLDQLIEFDKKLLLFLNSFHTSWLDPIMYFLSQTEAWLPLYVFLLYLIIKEYKKETWIVLLGIVLTILLADQITASVMKPYFERPRPSHEPTLQGLVHLVHRFSGEIYSGGKYGFASSHAANTFGVATFFLLLFKTKKEWIGWLFLWAATMSYTRIYLGVHYPGDILVGGLVGVLSGIAGFKFQKWLGQYVAERKTPPTTDQ
jgi:undecaprenyl-diphosphatase